VRLPTLLLANKADLLDHANTDLEVLAELEEPHFPVMLVSARPASAGRRRRLALAAARPGRVYTKAPGKPPSAPSVHPARGEQKVEDLRGLVHRDMAPHAQVRAGVGTLRAADGQHAGREHRLADGDILELQCLT